MTEHFDDLRCMMEAHKESISYLRDRIDKIEVVVSSLAALTTHMDYLRSAVVDLTVEMKELQRTKTQAQSSWHTITIIGGASTGLFALVLILLQIWGILR